MDAAQLAELKTLGNLTRRAWEDDLQVMVEVRDMPMDQIEFNVKNKWKNVSEATFYVLGSIGHRYCARLATTLPVRSVAAMAGWYGTAML
jgi:phosphomethylpyrimidine synthase